MHMSPKDLAFQEKVTGVDSRYGYVVDGVKFDGFKDGTLLDAKAKYGQFFDNKGNLQPWAEKVEKNFVKQAANQIRVADGPQ